MEEVKNLLTEMLRNFVTEPDAISISVAADEDERGALTMMTVNVHRNDLGMCIGERGSTAEALRRIIGLVGYKHCNSRVFVKVESQRHPNI